MTLTILAENHPHPEMSGLKSDHGFALHAQLEDSALLYDFGAEDTLLPNSKALGIDLSMIDTAILSHGHYDHADGIGDFLDHNDKAMIHHGRGAFQPRWSISKGSPREVGIKVIPTEEVVKRLTVVDSRIDKKTFVILPAATGHNRRPAGNAALLAGPEGNRLQDDFTDELTLVLRNPDLGGLVVVTGCSHRGILNIIDQIKTYCPECPIRALIGGFHLLDDKESQESLEAIGERMKKDLADTRIITGHCTGDESAAALQKIIGRELEILHVGMVISF